MRDENFYKQVYSKVVNSNGVSILHNIAHKKLESKLDSRTFQSVLEIGANEGEHLPYVKHLFDEYIMTDISYKKGPILDVGSPNKRVMRMHADAQELPFGDNVFDRVVVTCVLHHLSNPLSALKEIRRVVKPEGLISIHLSGDPSALYRLLWRIGSGRAIKKLGIKNERFMHALEHSGHFFGINVLILEFFKLDEMSMSSFPFKGDLTLFKTFQIKKRNDLG